MGYSAAREVQDLHAAEVLAARDAGGVETVGRLLLVEHDPVITIGRHPGSARHVLADAGVLARAGVEMVETDRGGDVTYHGPGQLVVYPILDLNRLGLGIHAYMRLLEDVAIAVCGRAGVVARREPGATGVWVDSAGGARKICAMGVRIRRWVSLHGLAINITTNLDHFGLIVPCGLAGRSVTSLRRELGEGCPTFDRVKGWMVEQVDRAVGARLLVRANREG